LGFSGVLEHQFITSLSSGCNLHRLFILDDSPKNNSACKLISKKHIFKPEDYVDAPVPEMGKFTRKMIIDSSTVGAKELSLLYGRYEGRAVGGNYERKCSHPNAEEILYITGGRGYVGIDSEQHFVEKGDAIWVPKDAVHWVYNPFEEPFEMLCVYSRASLREAGLTIHD